jgi:hypothetical protein
MSELEWEVRRIAAAFGVGEFQSREEDWLITSVGKADTTQILWSIDARINAFFYIEVGENGCEVDSHTTWPQGDEQWRFYPQPEFHELMARGLYCLGFEDEGVLAKLNYPLTAHEKLELRLAMPREFWPKMWPHELAKE